MKKKLFEMGKYLGGVLFGALVAAVIINWAPTPEAVPIPQTSNQYSVLEITHWYEVFGAPLTWPAEFVQHEVNFGCSSDSEDSGCFGTMAEINRGRIYLFIILALYGGLIFLYLPNVWGKAVSDSMQALIFGVTFLGLFLPYYWFFPEIIRHNGNSLFGVALVLGLIYVPAGLFGIYQIVREKLHKNKLLLGIIGGAMLAGFCLLSFYWYLYLAMGNSF
jgi:hypothetical protein